MQTDSHTLIDSLLELTEAATASAKRFKQLGDSDLNFKVSPEKWSILECFEHLNRYGDFYLPAIERAILSGDSVHASPVFTSGLIGDYFANLMRVKNGKIVRMKTPASKNPLGSELSVTTIDRFLKQQEMLRSLLERSRHVDLMKTKVPISLAKFIRLRLGDTFRFFVYHIERHIWQAENVLASKATI